MDFYQAIGDEACLTTYLVDLFAKIVFVAKHATISALMVRAEKGHVVSDAVAGYAPLGSFAMRVVQLLHRLQSIFVLHCNEMLS